MYRPPPGSPPTAPLFPYTTLFRSADMKMSGCPVLHGRAFRPFHPPFGLPRDAAASIDLRYRHPLGPVLLRASLSWPVIGEYYDSRAPECRKAQQGIVREIGRAHV